MQLKVNVVVVTSVTVIVAITVSVATSHDRDCDDVTVFNVVVKNVTVSVLVGGHVKVMVVS